MWIERINQLLEEQRIECYTTDLLATRISGLLHQTYIMVGFKVPEENDLAIITAKLTSDLFESYRYLTFGEVSLCFELGAKGEYGERVWRVHGAEYADVCAVAEGVPDERTALSGGGRARTGTAGGPAAGERGIQPAM